MAKARGHRETLCGKPSAYPKGKRPAGKQLHHIADIPKVTVMDNSALLVKFKFREDVELEVERTGDGQIGAEDGQRWGMRKRRPRRRSATKI